MIPAFPRRAMAALFPVPALSLVLCCPLGAAPILSEICADNVSLLADSDGDYSDWIEVHNPDDSAIDLGGYALTDTPSELQRWTFPSPTPLAPGEFLVVFASDKNRAIAGEELHTNFRLSAGGEYLALVAPDASVIQEFSPAFPPLDEDESYGVVFGGASLVIEGAASETRVPGDGTLGASWTEPGFITGAGWMAGTTGAGFGVDVPGITVRQFFSSGGMAGLSTVDSLIAGNGVISESTTTTPTINFLDTGGDGQFANNAAFPGGGGDNFAIQATGTMIIPQAGTWTFGINSDDGGRIRIGGTDVIVDDTFHGTQNLFGSITLSAGPHPFEFVMFEAGGGAAAEFFAAPGNFSSFSSAFRLVGDTGNGGLEVRTSPGGSAVGGFVGTDLTSAMKDQRPGAYVRVPFGVADPSEVGSLSLRMRYSDGFVAYLNGVEVASSGAPEPAVWDSAATTSRPDPLVQEAFNLTAFASLLTPGETNLLAIHGLSRSVGDEEFLILPELVGGGLLAGAPVVFKAPSPGSINTGPTSLGPVLDTKFDPDRGFYPNSVVTDVPFDVTITTATEGASIYYTTDGSEPSSTNGTLYTGPVMVTATTTLRARATKRGFEPTDIDSHTYLVLDDILTQSESAPPGWPRSPVNGQVFDYGMDQEIVGATDPAIGGGDRVREALLALPTLSISLPLGSLVDPSNGIYTNAGQRGFAWERAASLELIYPEGYVSPDGQTDGFQVGCGLRIRGGYSRSDSNPKHSFRLFFREEYGDTKLRYPMFGDEGADEFDGIDLRGPQNYAWAFEYGTRSTFLRDVWSRDKQREMGQPYTRSRYYHLYLNGIYWGMCMTQERAEADYAETYFGGEEEDYDVVKSFGDTADGNRESYRRLHAKWQAGFASDAAYYDIQGRDASGQYDPANHEHLVDIDNLIDYMILTYYTGDRDGPGSRFTQPRPNNYFGIFNRVDPKGYFFFEHDSEHSLGTGDTNMVSPFTTSSSAADFNPHSLHERLANDNGRYRREFSDRLQNHLAPGGPLHIDSALATLDARAETIDTAIIAHSARWGDSKQSASAPPRTRNTWLGAVAEVRDFMRNREDVLISQLRVVDWFPGVGAPVFAQHGGYIASDEQVRLGGTSGQIYITEDGADPRNEDGSVNGSASEFVGGTTLVPLIDQGATWKILDSVTAAVPGWETGAFIDSGWAAGPAPLGYGDGGLATEVGFVEDGSGDKNITTYFRHRFTLDRKDEISSVSLGIRRDDGAVVYLNGNEVARTNMGPGAITFTTPAAGVAGGADETTFQLFDLDPDALALGENLVAVEIHQVSGTSSDISFDLGLTATRITTATPKFLSGPGEVLVSARALEAGEWSPLNTARYYVDLVPADATNLAVSELSYRPAAPTPEEVAAGFPSRDDFEFIELTNPSPDHVHLRGLTFSDGIQFTFDDASAEIFVLAPGGHVVLVADRDAFAARYGTGVRVAGEYSGNLANGGETVAIDGVFEFTYDDLDPWPESPDGAGDTLVYKGGGSPNDPENWSASLTPNGTPGAAETSTDGLTFDVWLGSLGLAGASPDSDDDDDGLTLYAEYALGGNPKEPDLPRGPSVRATSSGGFAISVPVREEATDIEFTLEVSDSLGSFVRVDADPVAGNGMLLYEIPAVGAGIDRRFYRVRLSAR